MSQHDFDITPDDAVSGRLFRAAVNAALQALASNNSGSSAPATTFGGMFWADTNNDMMYVRNAGNTAWVAIGNISAGLYSVTSKYAADTGSAAAKYTYHALDSEELAGDATWLDLAQKSSQDQGTDKAPAAPDGNGQQPSGQKPSGDGKGQQPDGSQAKDAPTEGSSAKASDNTSKSDKTQKKPDKAPADNSAEAASKPDQKPDQAPDKAPADASSSSSMPKEDDSRVKEEYVDTDAVQKAIDGITDDDDLKSSLQTLLDAYTDALDAEKDGLNASDTSSDTLDTLHTAVMDARSALLSALKDAGIETEKLADPAQAPAQAPAQQPAPAPCLPGYRPCVPHRKDWKK